MLTKCPECELQVSDKAAFCPHCGYPFKQQSRVYKSTKRRRLPNGFGQITELKGKNLRKPFRAMVTIGKDEFGKPISKLLKPEAYFATYNEAYESLLKYNKDPFLGESSITMQELFDKWLETYDKSESRIKAVKVAWRYCYKIYDLPVASIRPRHIIFCLENGVINDKTGETHYATENMRKVIKSMLRQMLAFAVAREYTDKNYAVDVADSALNKAKRESATIEHKAFTDDEMKYLWDRSGKGDIADMILIQCYTGFRPSELVSIKLANVDLENMSITGGMKTDAGTNRIVPIHSAIADMVKNFYTMSKTRGNKYLFGAVLPQISYNAYNLAFTNTLPNHKPHDPRKHFITMAKKYKVDEYAIKLIVGHKIDDLTERLYTERDLNWLKEEVEKIKN